MECSYDLVHDRYLRIAWLNVPGYSFPVIFRQLRGTQNEPMKPPFCITVSPRRVTLIVTLLVAGAFTRFAFAKEPLPEWYREGATLGDTLVEKTDGAHWPRKRTSPCPTTTSTARVAAPSAFAGTVGFARWWTTVFTGSNCRWNWRETKRRTAREHCSTGEQWDLAHDVWSGRSGYRADDPPVTT